MAKSYLKLMVKAEQCTTRKKAKKILKKVAKLNPPTHENSLDS